MKLSQRILVHIDHRQIPTADDEQGRRPHVPIARTEAAASTTVGEQHDTGGVLGHRKISVQGRATSRNLHSAFGYVRMWYSHQVLASLSLMHRLNRRGIGFGYFATIPPGRSLQRFDCARLVKVE